MVFKSVVNLLDFFKDEETCVKFYEQKRWKGNVTCPTCNTGNPYVTKVGYRCRNKDCFKNFNVKKGTIFENSKIEMRLWFAVAYLMTTSKKGISSIQVSNQINVTQKTAWFMMHRIREMYREKTTQKLGQFKEIELDEAHIGGKERFKHFKKRRARVNGVSTEFTNEGKPYKPKKIVLGMVERGGKVILKHVASRQKDDLLPVIERTIPYGARVYTDDYNAYTHLYEAYHHQSVCHSYGNYVTGEAHTNTIENVWSTLKRGITGIYQQVSEKHIDRYLGEFAGRYNTRKFPRDVRFEHFLEQADVRLSYKMLTQAA